MKQVNTTKLGTDSFDPYSTRIRIRRTTSDTTSPANWVRQRIEYWRGGFAGEPVAQKLLKPKICDYAGPLYRRLRKIRVVKISVRGYYLNMKFKLLFVFLLVFAFSNKSYSFPYSTNLAPYCEAINVEGKLVSLLLDTNGLLNFDNQICKSLSLSQKKKWIICYEEISFVFYYPLTNECSQSSQEMSLPDTLIYGNGHITRVDSLDKIPVNYVRVVERKLRDRAAQVDFIIQASPERDPGAARYFRRSFQFTYKGEWESSKSPIPLSD